MQLTGNGELPGAGGGALKDKGKPVAIESATDYDPEGDGEEGRDTVELAVDGNLSTAWSSEHYEDAEFAGTKSGPEPIGVGLYVTTKSPASPDVMIVHTPKPGWSAQIYASSGEAPAEISEWGKPVAEVEGASKLEEVELDLAGNKYDNFLLWFTKAAPDGEGRYAIEISEIKLTES